MYRIFSLLTLEHRFLQLFWYSTRAQVPAGNTTLSWFMLIWIYIFVINLPIVDRHINLSGCHLHVCTETVLSGVITNNLEYVSLILIETKLFSWYFERRRLRCEWVLWPWSFRDTEDEKRRLFAIAMLFCRFWENNVNACTPRTEWHGIQHKSIKTEMIPIMQNSYTCSI